MSSKTATKIHDRAHDLVLAATQNVATIEAALAKVLDPLLEAGESPPSWVLPQVLVRRLTERLGRNLMAQDDVHSLAQLEVRKKREYRDELASQLLVQVLDARNLFRRLYGPGQGPTVTEFDARLSRQDPRKLVRVARQVIEILRKPGFAFPPAEPSLLVPEPLAFAATLEEPTRRLESTLDDSLMGKTASVAVRQVRNDHLAETREGVRRCFQFLFGLYQLAGMDLLAEELRPSARRKKSEETKPPEPSPPLAEKPQPASTDPKETPVLKTRRIRRRSAFPVVLPTRH